MKLSLSSKDWEALPADLAVTFLMEGQRSPLGIDDAARKRWFAARLKEDGFKGQTCTRTILAPPAGAAARRWLVVGLGAGKTASDESLRTAIAEVLLKAGTWSAKKVVFRLPEESTAKHASMLQAAVEGTGMGAYRFDRHLTDPDRKELSIERVTLAVSQVNKSSRDAFARGQTVARAIVSARDWINEAPSRMTPRAMVAAARAVARRAGLTIRVMGRTQLEKVGMHALLSVARGSTEEPFVVHLTYKPNQARAKSTTVLVGKGVTFDSGGLNLKPGAGMLGMKADMSGSAAVLATMSTLADLESSHEVHGFLGLTENMTGGAAYKPGDILDTWLGKTVEVGNTDAEGRLVMCDVLAYAADKIRPDRMIDVATLTGACVVALGTQATGVFSRHDKLTEELLAASRAAGEKFWPLPMYEEYLALLQKGPADLHNVGGRWGGATTAALFLGEFVPRNIPWAHLDIAGPAFQDEPTRDAPLGATGAAVRTLSRWLSS
jgi:leucyl aminopeptidase